MYPKDTILNICQNHHSLLYYIFHKKYILLFYLFVDWTTLSYVGNQSFMAGVPMGRVYSVSDGTINNSTGVPYIMASPMDLSFQDVVVNVIKY